MFDSDQRVAMALLEHIRNNKKEMKTPMQEVYENFNKMSDADFKAWMLNTDLLEKEKKQIINAYEVSHISMMTAEQYYNETFNTEE